MKLGPDEYVLDWMACPFCKIPMYMGGKATNKPTWYCKQCKHEIAAEGGYSTDEYVDKHGRFIPVFRRTWSR